MNKCKAVCPAILQYLFTCLFSVLMILSGFPAQSHAGVIQTVYFQRGDLKLKGYLCMPSGSGPFPVVVYNHGGMGNIIGGDPEGTCKSLAKEGFIGFAPIRRATRSMRGHIDDVFAGLEYARGLKSAASDRAALIGFSRGGLLTFIAGTRRANLKALVIMATAMGGKRMRNVLDNADAIQAPVLVLVAKNDTGSKRTNYMDTVKGSHKMVRALKKAGKDVKFIIYPPYGSDGHTMFFTVGSYWKDVSEFLQRHLSLGR